MKTPINKHFSYQICITCSSCGVQMQAKANNQNDIVQVERTLADSLIGWHDDEQNGQSIISCPNCYRYEVQNTDRYLTVRQYQQEIDNSLTQGELSFLSQLCREQCESQRIEIKFSEPDARHNARPMYPQSVIAGCINNRAQKV